MISVMNHILPPLSTNSLSSSSKYKDERTVASTGTTAIHSFSIDFNVDNDVVNTSFILLKILNVKNPLDGLKRCYFDIF